MLSFDNASAAAHIQFDVRASVVRYPWVDTHSAFESSSTVLNAVYSLCRYTLKATSLDTFTDSNTRERLPYELDGKEAALACWNESLSAYPLCQSLTHCAQRLRGAAGFIAARSRFLLQREYTWTRHSFLYHL